MDARVDRFDFHSDVVFTRPAFSRVASFVQIIEPLYDAFDAAGIRIPSDALCFENGNSISTAKVTLSLFSGFYTFEAHFLDLRSLQAVEQARRFARLFGNTVCRFLSDGLPDRYTITTPTWLTVDGGYDAAEALVRRVGWQPESNDPFRKPIFQI
ncbi:MAG: hypothetical protein OXC26_20655 [Albidovulum sp.]|nr:hypothetical protein [Albidovulum sp.]